MAERPTDDRGVDLAQIRALLSLSPAERLRRLDRAAANLKALRKECPASLIRSAENAERGHHLFETDAGDVDVLRASGD